MNVNLDIKSGAENIFPKKIVRTCFFDGALKNLRAFREFAADINIRGARIERVTRDQNSFEQLVWVLMDDVAILKCTWLRFISVADQIDRPLFVRFDEAPFQAAGKSGSTAAAQARVFDLIDNFAARYPQRLLQFFVTAIAQVTIDISRPI